MSLNAKLNLLNSTRTQLLKGWIIIHRINHYPVQFGLSTLVDWITINLVNSVEETLSYCDTLCDRCFLTLSVMVDTLYFDPSSHQLVVLYQDPAM